MRRPAQSHVLRRALAIVAGVAAALASAGCVKPLFPEDKPRTQFETYDRMRSRFVPLEEPDAFGVPRPALRARLSQRP